MNVKNVLAIKSKQSELRTVTKASDLNRAVTLYANTLGKKLPGLLCTSCQTLEFTKEERKKKKHLSGIKMSAEKARKCKSRRKIHSLH